jgi:F-type H+-transporting ATPase subunit b
MSINVTLFVQMLVFLLLVWFIMSFVWPLLAAAMEEREKKIADGLAAASKGEDSLNIAKTEADKLIEKAKFQAREIIDQGNSRANSIIEEGRTEGAAERQRLIEKANSEIQIETNKARDDLRTEVSSLVVLGASKVINKEIDASKHKDLLDQLAAEL